VSEDNTDIDMTEEEEEEEKAEVEASPVAPTPESVPVPDINSEDVAARISAEAEAEAAKNPEDDELTEDLGPLPTDLIERRAELLRRAALVAKAGRAALDSEIKVRRKPGRKPKAIAPAVITESEQTDLTTEAEAIAAPAIVGSTTEAQGDTMPTENETDEVNETDSEEQPVAKKRGRKSLADRLKMAEHAVRAVGNMLDYLSGVDEVSKVKFDSKSIVGSIKEAIAVVKKASAEVDGATRRKPGRPAKADGGEAKKPGRKPGRPAKAASEAKKPGRKPKATNGEKKKPGRKPKTDKVLLKADGTPRKKPGPKVGSKRVKNGEGEAAQAE
jgi:hypothetical protein